MAGNGAAQARSQGRDDRVLQGGCAHRIGAPAGAGRLLGALVRPLQAARAGAGEGGRQLQGQGDARQDEHRRAPANRRPARHPVDPGGHRLRQRPAGRRFHGRVARKPGARLHRAPRRPADGRRRRDHRRGRKGRRRSGDAAGAASLYARVLTEDETNPKAIGGLARLHVEAGDLDQARAVLSMAAPPAPGKDPHPAIAAALAALQLAEQASSVGDLGAAWQSASPPTPTIIRRASISPSRSTPKATAPARPTQLLEIIKRDRAWNEDARAQAIAAVFRGLGPDGPRDGRGAAKTVGDLVLNAARGRAVRGHEAQPKI